MKLIINALNNIAESINNLANSIKENRSDLLLLFLLFLKQLPLIQPLLFLTLGIILLLILRNKNPPLFLYQKKNMMPLKLFIML
jgi:hypothetical protein